MGFLSTKKKVAELEEGSGPTSTSATDRPKKGAPSLRQVAMKKRPQQWSASKKSEKNKMACPVWKQCSSSSTPSVSAEYKFEKSTPQLELKKLHGDLDDDSTGSEKVDSSGSASASSTWVLVSRIFGGGSSSS